MTFANRMEAWEYLRLVQSASEAKHGDHTEEIASVTVDVVSMDYRWKY